MDMGTEPLWQEVNAFENLKQEEEWPDDPPRTVERTKLGLRARTPFSDRWIWAVWGPTCGKTIDQALDYLASSNSGPPLDKM